MGGTYYFGGVDGAESVVGGEGSDVLKVVD